MFLFMFVINSLMAQSPGVIMACLGFLLLMLAIVICLRVKKYFRNQRLYDSSDLSSLEKPANSNADVTVDDHINPDHAGLQKIRQDITYGVV